MRTHNEEQDLNILSIYKKSIEDLKFKFVPWNFVNSIMIVTSRLLNFQWSQGDLIAHTRTHALLRVN